MTKLISITLGFLLCISCATNKEIIGDSDLPECLKEKIVKMSEDPSQGTPLYVTEYNYKGKTVYYVAAACCDKYNIVFDSDCKILGYPDGGFTGKGDGSLPDFRQEATNGKVIWVSKQKTE